MAKWDAGLYDSKHSFVWEKAKDLVQLLAPQPGEHILDIGCGTGQLTAEIASTGAQIVGVDRSLEMIAQARNKFPALRFEVCDARELHFTAEFDAVFSNAVLHWILDAERVAAGVARALKPQGRFVAEFGGHGNVQRVMDGFAAALATFGVSADGANSWFYPSIAEYSSILEKHGLEVLQAVLFDRPTTLEDGDRGLANWIAMFGDSVVRHIPETQRAHYVRAVEDAARPALWKGDHWELDYRRLRIVARKSLS